MVVMPVLLVFFFFQLIFGANKCGTWIESIFVVVLEQKNFPLIKTLIHQSIVRSLTKGRIRDLWEHRFIFHFLAIYLFDAFHWSFFSLNWNKIRWKQSWHRPHTNRIYDISSHIIAMRKMYLTKTMQWRALKSIDHCR